MADFSDCTFKIDPRKITMKQFNHKLCFKWTNYEATIYQAIKVSQLQKMQQNETNENINNLYMVKRVV